MPYVKDLYSSCGFFFLIFSICISTYFRAMLHTLGLSKTYNAPMKKQRERTSTFCVLRQIVPLIPFVFCLCFTHSVCSYQALIEIITSFYCTTICFLFTYLGCFFQCMHARVLPFLSYTICCCFYFS